jgi:YVTN family beta-propeller protein
LGPVALFAVAGCAPPSHVEKLAQQSAADLGVDLTSAQKLPTGQRLTPTAAPGSTLVQLNPGLADFPSFTVDWAMSEALSPDQKTLLVLTSGYDQNDDSTGYYSPILADSNQYVFVFDVSGHAPVQEQVLQVPNTFAGIAFAPDGRSFYVAGGSDDVVHTYGLRAGQWTETGSSPIALNHPPGNGSLPDGYTISPMASGLAVTEDGKRLVVANHYNDSISVVDIAGRAVQAELDLRPGKSGGPSGKPGGEYPFWVSIAGNRTAYVSSLRDREVVVVDLSGVTPGVAGRIPVRGNPNRMILDRARKRLFVASDAEDVVSVIDTATSQVAGVIPTLAPAGAALRPNYRGASPNALSLSPDEKTLYVSNRGTNAVAVVALNGFSGSVVGLVPTGWYPQDVVVSTDGERLFVIDAKSNAGPNPGDCYGLGYPGPTGSSTTNCLASSPIPVLVPNTYVYNLEKAGFQTIPVPSSETLETLTHVVVENNGLDSEPKPAESDVIEALRAKIKHVIYIVKENRTYDQILGDLGEGDGDPSLTEFGRKTTPNQHALAQEFVDLDAFFVPGEVSGNGWPWSMAGRETDEGSKINPLNYAWSGRGGSYDWQGPNRNINIGLDEKERLVANPLTPTDPDLLPGHGDVAAADGPEGEVQQGYLWNAVLRAGLTVRNYGFDVDETLYDPVFGSNAIPLDRTPAAHHRIVAWSSHPELSDLTDPYYRSFDSAFPDYWREQEWAREFDAYCNRGDLPSLSMLYFSSDHTGGFDTAIDGVNTPELEVADNDYAVGKLVEALASSRYRDDTLVFIVEDDAQDGADHVDAHRSIAFVAGPYVRQGAVVHTRYSTVNVIRTIEDVLGVDHLGVFDANQPAMTDVFDPGRSSWSFEAHPSRLLASTSLPIPKLAYGGPPMRPTHDARYWARVTRGMNFARHDGVDARAYNRVLWRGLQGSRAYPGESR